MTHEEFSLATYDVPPLVFYYLPPSSAKSQIHYRTQKEEAKFGLNINREKTKIMKVGKWNEAEDEKIMIDGREVESVDAFCYIGSLMAAESNCDREIKVCIGRANATFGRLDKIW